jgi:predicted DNA-binding transcriptional regulator YafY
MVSPTFFAWVMSFGADMRIVSPASVKDEMLCTLEKILENYK